MQISSNETLTMAVSAVWTNRFRSLLTILGIVIGITTVVTVSSLLSGVRQNVVTFFQEFGPDNVFIQRFSGGPGNNPGLKERRRRPLLPEYADILKRSCPSVKETSVSLFIPGFIGREPISAKAGSQESDNVNMIGASAEAFNTQPRELQSGRPYTAEEAKAGAAVALIGANVAEALFPAGDAVGKQMIAGGAEYTIVGVFAKAKGGFFGENGMDNQIMIPLKTAQGRFPQLDRYLIVAQAYAGQREEAYGEVENMLRRLRKVPAGEENDFSLSTADQIVQQFDRITGMIVLVSIALSALGLLVGGIGVMNIMLVSVTERTREIGVRKAVGARRFDIVFQFLLEAVALTMMGGLLGVIIAVALTQAIGFFAPSLSGGVSWTAVGMGVAVSVAVGLFFGVWPAFKAARLDPVEALRYE